MAILETEEIIHASQRTRSAKAGVVIAVIAAAILGLLAGRVWAADAQTGVPATTSYSEAELSVAAEAVLHAAQDGSIPTVSYVTWPVDRTALDVAVPQALFDARGEQALIDAIATATGGIPVEILIGEPVQSVLPQAPTA